MLSQVQCVFNCVMLTFRRAFRVCASVRSGYILLHLRVTCYFRRMHSMRERLRPCVDACAFACVQRTGVCTHGAGATRAKRAWR